MNGQACKWTAIVLMVFTTPLFAYWSETHQKFADAAYTEAGAIPASEIITGKTREKSTARINPMLRLY